MKCPSCGAEVSPEDVFCGECGSQLPQKKRKLALPVLIGAVAGLLGVGFLCCVVILMWPTEPTPTPEAETAVVSATPTWSPVLPTPTVSSWPVALADDFDDPESGFSDSSYEDYQFFYQGGRYGIEISREDWVAWTSLGEFSDFVMEVDVISEGDDGYAGVLFRREGDYQFYLFGISADGRYRLRKSAAEGDWEEILDWQESPHIRTGAATNRLRVRCEGSEISLYVNGEYLNTVQDTSFSQGMIGLAASTFAGQSYGLFHFDNLRVYAPTEGPTVLFQDDFSDPGSGWEIEEHETGSVGYRDGIYFVTSLGDGEMVWGGANRSFDNLAIGVDATQISAPANDNNAYGIMCRIQPNDDGYLLHISGDGYYSIHTIVNGAFEEVVGWASSDVIEQGDATNHMRAVCDGSNLALFVNGELLAQATDSTFSEGDIGLTATSFEEEATEMHFDNLVVYAPSGE